jgi:transposase-like protein
MLVQRRRDKRAALRLMRKLLRKQGFVPKLLTTDKLDSRPSQPPSDVKLLRPLLPSDRDCQVDATDDRRGFRYRSSNFVPAYDGMPPAP